MVTVTKPALNLREQLAKLAGLEPSAEQETFWYAGDSSETDFALPEGWKPMNAFVDGAIKRPGSGEDYEVNFDGFIYTVSFAVAPGVVDIAITAERRV